MKRKRISAKDIGYGLFFTFLVFLILILQKAFIQIYKKESYLFSSCMETGSTLQARKNIFQKKENI
jgi:hypothetical protein